MSVAEHMLGLRQKLSRVGHIMKGKITLHDEKRDSPPQQAHRRKQERSETLQAHNRRRDN